MAQPASGDKRAAIVAWTRQQVGKPYVWGGTGPNGYDCSGLVFAAYSANGVSIPRTSEQQYAACRHIDRSQLQPADPVFFVGAVDASHPSPAHEAMYVGGGDCIVAPRTGERVQYAALGELDIRDSFVGAGSFLPDDGNVQPIPTAPGGSSPPGADLSGAAIGCACWALPEALGFHASGPVCRQVPTCRAYRAEHGRFRSWLRVALCNPVTAR